MKRAPALTFLILLAVSSLIAQEEIPERPAVEGFVTRATSPSDFDVNTIRIVCDEKTSSGWSNSDTSFSGCPKNTPGLGTTVTVFGTPDKKQNRIQASKILQHPSPAAGGDVSGSAVIDAQPVRNAPSAPPGTIMVRADGYWIVLPFSAEITLWGSIKSVEAVDANTWIEYAGRMRPDGVVVANRAKLMSNILTRSEAKLRDKVKYDPASAAAAPSQSRMSAAIEGVDFSRIHPSSDAGVEARVTAIGEKLVPAYQRQLPSADPAKLNFRFLVVESNWGLFPLALPDGSVLVPQKGVERMENDAQIAALLAEAVATILEKQDLRMHMTIKALSTAQWATLAVGFVPGPVGVAAWAGGEAVGFDKAAVCRREMTQSLRVSLSLLHDAGYDESQAPLAWWLVFSGKRPLSEANPPPQSVTLYHALRSRSEPQVSGQSGTGR